MYMYNAGTWRCRNLLVLKPKYSARSKPIHGCWCCGSLCCQAISSHGIDCIRYAHLRCDRIIHRTPHVPRAMPVRASYGPRAGISNVLHILWGQYGARAGPTRVPYDTFTYTYGNWHNQNLQKSHTGLACSHTGPIRTPYGPRTGCSRAVDDL